MDPGVVIRKAGGMHPHHEALSDAIRDEDLDTALELATLDDLAAAWCSLYRGQVGSQGGPDQWAWDFFNCRSISERRELFQRAILKLLEHADDELLGSVGAGPLENYFTGEVEDLRWMAEQARTNDRFRVALGFVSHGSAEAVRTLVRDGQWWFDPPLRS